MYEHPRLLTVLSLIGDDLTVTNLKCLQKAYQTGAVQGFVFKPNQIGTVTEAIEARRFAKDHGMLTIPSQRMGGGTIWDVVIDMGIGLEVEACKSCAPRGGESIYAMNAIYRAADENPQAKMFDFSPWVRF
jgi:enolase